MHVSLIEVGGVEGASPQKLFVCCSTSTPESVPDWFFKYQNLGFRAHLMDFKKWLCNKSIIL